MADQGDKSTFEADSEAKKWFVLAVIGTVLYVGAVFTFVINGDLGDEGEQEQQQAQESEHGQPE